MKNTRLRSGFKRRAPWTTSLALGLCCAAAVARSEVKPAGEVSAILLEVPTNAPGSVDRLLALGPDHLPEYFEILSNAHFPIRVGERGNSRRALSPAQEEVLFETVTRLPRAGVLGLFASLEVTGSEAQKVAALELLGRFGTPAELALLARVASPEPGKARVALPIRAAFGAAFGQVLQRNRGAEVADLRSTYRSAHPSLLASMITEVARERTVQRLDLLVALLGEVPEVDRLILAEITRQATTLKHLSPDKARSTVRYYLWRDDPQVLVEASAAAGALEDKSAVPFLIDLLGNDDANVHGAALQALEGLSGRQLGRDPERWTRWHEAEQDWWSREAPAELNTIAHGKPGEASRLVLDLSKKRFFRHELSTPLSAGLQREETDLVVLTCAALGHLGSWSAVPHLTQALEHRDTEVQSAAWRALQRITGLNLGPTPALWKGIVPSQDSPNPQ